MAHAENHRYIVQVFVGALSAQYEALSVEASKQTSSEEIVCCIADKLSLNDGGGGPYELAEVVGDTVSGECKERRLGPNESPVAVMMLWPNNNSGQYYRFYLREKIPDEPWMENFSVDPQLIKDYFQRFLYQPKDREYPDLCQLPELNEQTLLDNLRARFAAGYIYTYVGSILIALNPFKFYPIYNPKYVKLYQNKRIGSSLPPHIFAVADAAYHCMLRERTNQCIVISGESGSGKTESTNFLLHHLTALSQKGSHGSGVEQTILSAGPVLEAFGNAKTAHNNNSSRFGKFIQVNYKENGMVHGAVVQKYLLEKSRICSQGRNERNYHVFYYLLAGASEQEKEQLHLLSVDKYNYLSKTGCSVVPGVDEQYEFSRLKQSMDMVGFTMDKQRRLFAVLSAVLLLGNVEFHPQRKSYHHDEAVGVRNPEVVSLISSLLRVKQETLLAALTSKRARASGETLVINYRLPEAIATRDAMAKCLYGALFDWIVMQVNHALLSKKDTLREHQGHSIGVLDIFGFEDFGPSNSFEQLCINYANEHLQYYFNQHVFKYEQEEYRREGIRWTDIGFSDNTGCLQLIEGKPGGLLCLLDDQCNFPWATNETLLQKFNSVHEDNPFYEKPQRREPAFVVRHYAGRVKYQVTAMREKNLDLMRQDIVSVLKNSSLAFVRELVGVDPVAVFRWAIVRAFFRGYFAFLEAGRRHRVNRVDGASRVPRPSIQAPNDSIIRGRGYRLADTRARRHQDDHDVLQRASLIVMKNKSFRPRERAKKGLKNLQSVKTLAGRTAAPAGKRKQPLTVAAQFQHSLAQLMETLNQANPFFIRCIKSNSDKVPNVFDEETVQRQLRYTGMLETVRIRQAGYNVRLTYDEFIQLYRILLPKGLLSSQTDVRHFLATLNLDRDNYQLGATKIFMRESEQTKLEYRLHQQIMASIITIQRWFRAVLERRRFLALRRASLVIQGYCRQWLVLRQEAAMRIQAYFRGSRVRRWYLRLKEAAVMFQAAARGFLLRKTLPELRRVLPKKKHENKAVLIPETDVHKTKQPSIEQLKSIIDIQLNMLIQEEAEKTRQLRATQSLPIASLEKKRDNLIESSTVLTYNKKRVSKTQNISETAMKQSNVSLHQEANESSPDESWNVNSNKYPHGIVAWPNKITPEDLANELLWLRLDQNYLMAEKNKRERELAESIASSSEEYLRQVGDWSPAESSDTTKSSSRRTSPQVYQRSLSSTTLEPPSRSLHSLPPVRRDPRDQRDSREHRDSRDQRDSRPDPHADLACVSLPREPPPAPPARAARRSPRRAPPPAAPHSAPLPLQIALPLPMTVDHADIKRAASEVSVGPGETLRRRNSDPAPEPRAPPPDYIGHTANGLFGIAGHRFRKGTRFAKCDKCVYCHQAIDAFVTQGQRCIDCKQLYHTKCIQNKGVITMPCPSPVTVATRNRNKIRKRAMVKDSPYNFTDPKGPAISSNFSITGTSEFMDRTDKIISDATELQAMQSFITKKIYLMDSSENEKQSDVDRVFKHALREFKDNLVATYSVVETRGSALKYKDLIGNFLHVMETVCAREGSTLSITMGVNAFRGFMDEFMSQHETDKARTKRKKDKKRKLDDPIQYKGHNFILTMINIPTECEICKTFFMWPIERSLICQTCRLASHKKCYMKVLTHCRKDAGTPAAAIVGAVDAGGREQFGVLQRGKVFGVPLSELPTGEGNIPIVVDRLITTIEMTGLYTEGLYRKSGLSSKVRELRRLLDERPDEGAERLDSYAVHVRASVLKSFFRELPEPLLTFDLYDDFMLAAEISDLQERVSTIFTILKKLPKPNYDMVERLIFHLARVALGEDHNRMGPNALAIVFAPCILRTHKVQPAQDSLHDIARQTACLEAILVDKINNTRGTLADIATLDKACATASDRLTMMRRSAACRPEERILEGHIHEIQKEKAILTSNLPSLFRATSDDDLLSTTDHDGEFGSTDDISTGASSLRSQRLLHRQLSSDDPIMVDRVFKHALREFKDNLVATYSVVETRGSALKYKDLIGNFLHVMETVCAREGSTLSITMGVNAFRCFMDEFMSQHETDKARTKRKKDKKRKLDDPIQYKGHNFILTMINIPTECEICKTFFMWPIERSLICQTCRLASHKKCYMKVLTHCRKDAGTPAAAIVGAVDAGGREQFGVLQRGKVFGVPLSELPTGEGNIPIVVDRLITTIEMTGLYTEGLYRKSGLSSKVRELRRLLDERPDEGAERLDSYAVHVRASVLKSFFRELPEPLLTFDLYDDFMLAAEISDLQERVSTIFTILKKLPKPNYDMVERLIFHLARVALGEDHNRMGPNALAIVFAPCILRTHKVQPAQDSLHDIARQTACLEAILVDKINNTRGTLADIATLDKACATASDRLTMMRRSAACRPEERILEGHIHEIQKEKAILTSNLPSLFRATSDDDLLSTTDHDGEFGSTDDISTGASSLRSQRLLHRQLSSDDPIMVDRVFKHALREFKDNLVATYSVVETRGSALKYKDLIGNFLHVMETVCAREGSTLSITMGVNAFRGFMDEFMSQHETDKARTKRKKDKKRKLDDPIQYKGHNFILTMINIPTECEICKTFFMWPIERSLICQTCRLASHKKCYMKVLTHCRKDAGTPAAAIVGAVDAGGREQFGVLQRGKVFGVPLSELPTGEGNIPIVVDRLITTIEMTGLYTEGLYRKSGLSSKVRELRRLLDERPDEGAERLDSYAVHVRASVLKSFFRELPEPLLTFDLYDDFMLAAEISDLQERVSTIFTILKKLPKPNYDMVERLIFHLARVALGEDHNRMGPNALAIVFAPCILRTHKVQPAQDSLHDIARQTACLEAILVDKINNTRGTLADIATLDKACATASDRLTMMRRSAACRPEERILEGHIHEIQKEKAILTSNLPSLFRATSDDDLLSTTDHDGEFGSTDDISTGASSLRSQRLLHRQLSSDDPIMVDRVFKHALREFKDNLVATYSVVETRGSALKYKDLIGNFLHVMETVCAREGSTLSITMGVNAFRGFMDEFMSQHETDKARTKRKKDKKRKLDDPIQYKGHNFILTMINIPTECEICKTFFMWPIERSLICQTCRLASHKKCYMKVLTHCRKDAGTPAAAIVGAVDAGGREQFGVLQRGKVFGVPLSELPTGEGNIPIVVDRLITTIEMTGLYTEGLYRKSGLSSKVRELRRLLDERPDEGAERLDSYAVHVRASVLKSFFRELPEPLLTFDLYDDFMLAAEISDLQERVSTIFTILKKLPKPNYDMVERLIFHLARVALGEDHNRMGPNALAIVFAPCILRTHKVQPAQDSLHDIARQTACLEAILVDKINNTRGTLADIATLDKACATASDRLTMMRRSAACRPEERILEGHIHEIQKEKAILTSNLPSLFRATSDDDLLSTTDHDGEFGSTDDISTGASSLRSQRLLHRQLSSDDPIMV